MTNWVKRKTTKGRGGARFTTTTNTGKGFTFSQSIGNKSGRITMTQMPSGKTRTTQIYHAGGMSMRKTVFSSSPKKIKYKKIRTNKITKVEALSCLFSSKYFWWGLIFIMFVYVFYEVNTSITLLTN